MTASIVQERKRKRAVQSSIENAKRMKIYLCVKRNLYWGRSCQRDFVQGYKDSRVFCKAIKI
jgi:hypothetical protein